MSTSPSAPAEWRPDPTGRFDWRYWNGSAWTEHVSTKGVQSSDPIVPGNAPAAPAPSVPSGVAVGLGPSTTAPVAPAAAAHARGASTGAVPAPRKISFFGAKKQAEALLAEKDRLRALIDQYGLADAAALDEVKRQLEQEVAAVRQQLDQARDAVAAAQGEKASVEQQIVNLRDVAHLQEYGLFDYENPAESSVALQTELESVQTQIKQAVRAGTATSATPNFTFNNSQAKGRKFVNDMSKLLLRAYNAEAENCVKTTRAGNLAAAQKRLSTVVTQIERLGSMIQLRINDSYHYLRLKELELVSRHLQALQAEKEMERARREELREQRKAEQELQREKERLEKERSHYANALAALEANGDLEGAARLREKLTDVERAIEDVDYRAANIRAGYVYVISNIGAFGPDVVKIGLTRRLDPMDRINELGDASVPFRFDVHALFFAEDAVSIETMLHQHFADRRLNKVNLRREYFRATPAEVLEVLKQHDVEVLEFVTEPEAIEYRSSLAESAVNA